MPRSRLAEPKGLSTFDTAVRQSPKDLPGSQMRRGGDLLPTLSSAFLELFHFCQLAKWKRDYFFFFLQKNYISLVIVEVKHLFIPLFIFLFLLQCFASSESPCYFFFGVICLFHIDLGTLFIQSML